MFLSGRRVVSPSFICRESYKLHSTLNLTEISFNRPKHAYALVCIPTYNNKFCLQPEQTDWMTYSCRSIKELIECPLFEEFEIFREFFNWKIRKMAVKIRLSYGINETFFESDHEAVSPVLRCRDIKQIKRNNVMFKKNNQ